MGRNLQIYSKTRRSSFKTKTKFNNNLMKDRNYHHLTNLFKSNKS